MAEVGTLWRQRLFLGIFLVLFILVPISDGLNQPYGVRNAAKSFSRGRRRKSVPSTVLFSRRPSSNEATEKALTSDLSSRRDAAENSDLSDAESPATPSSSSSLSSFIQQNVLLGIPPSPELAAIITIYFVQGALGLSRLAQTYLLKDNLHLGPAELSGLTGLFSLPWTIKPVYGFVTDSYKLFGYRRKSYLIAAGLLGGLCYLLLGNTALWDSLDDTTTAIYGTVAALVASSACIALSDVVADGIVVQETQKYPDNQRIAGGLQSLCWGAASAGSLLSAYYSGSLLQVYSVRDVFQWTAVLPFLVAAISVGVNERQDDIDAAIDDDYRIESSDAANVDKPGKLQQQLDLLWEALQQPSIYKPAAFIFLWQATPTADGAFFFFLSNDLGLGPEFLGRIRLLTAGAGLVGVFLYQTFLRTQSIKNVLFWCTLASFPLGMLPVLLITHVNQALGIPDTALIFGDDAALAALGQISFMPTLVLAARLCPPGIEAVLFATLMSINNAAGTLGTELGALLTKLAGVTEDNFDNLAWLTVFCNVSSLFPLLFINWLDEADDSASNDDPKLLKASEQSDNR